MSVLTQILDKAQNPLLIVPIQTKHKIQDSMVYMVSLLARIQSYALENAFSNQ